MEFGDKEWFAKVEEQYNFPVVLAAYISNRERSMVNMEVQSTAINVGDIKFSKLASYGGLDNGEKLALIGVQRVHSSEQYYNWSKGLKEDWA